MIPLNTSNQPNLSAEQYEQLVRLAGQKMGLSPQELKSRLGSNPAGLMQNLSPDQAAQLQALLQNPARIRQLLESPAARAVLAGLMGGNRHG